MPIECTSHPEYDTDEDDKVLVIHASNCGVSGEFTACGISMDEWEMGIHEGEKPKQVNKPITCEYCITVIEFYKNNFKKINYKWRQK